MTTKNKSLQTINAGDWRKGNLSHYWWECKFIQSLRRIVWRFCKKLAVKVPYDPAVPLLGVYPEETTSEKRYVPSVH